MKTKTISEYTALLFDLNGTIIDDMDYHIKAWYRIFNELGANITIERTRDECYGKNDEVLERVFPGRFSENEKNKLSDEKEKQYRQEFKPHLALIGGLDNFLDQAYKTGRKIAIGSAAIRANIDFVIDGLNIRHYFGAIVSADDVKHSKPDPETWFKCAAQLGVKTGECLVFEDSPKGVESARNAGMDAVVITTMHNKEEFDYNNIVSFIDDYRDEWLRHNLIKELL
jgi:beta-phosphoglucomutase